MCFTRSPRPSFIEYKLDYNPRLKMWDYYFYLYKIYLIYNFIHTLNVFLDGLHFFLIWRELVSVIHVFYFKSVTFDLLYLERFILPILYLWTWNKALFWEAKYIHFQGLSKVIYYKKCKNIFIIKIKLCSNKYYNIDLIL